jgi:putative membrane protein
MHQQKSSYYQDFLDGKIGATDFFAADRNILASERTLLAYIRTALALVIAGGSAVHFFSSIGEIKIAGFTLIGSGLFMLVFGFFRHRAWRHRINRSMEAIATLKK